jgi:hypothetical protein
MEKINREEREEREERKDKDPADQRRVWLPGSRPDSPLSPEGEWAMRQLVAQSLSIEN